jgi:hypothetical protein
MTLELVVRTVGGLLQLTILGIVALDTWRVHGPGRPRRFGYGEAWLEGRQFPASLDETERRLRLMEAKIEELRSRVTQVGAEQQRSYWVQRRTIAVRPWQIPVLFLGVAGTTWPGEIAALLAAAASIFA